MVSAIIKNSTVDMMAVEKNLALLRTQQKRALMAHLRANPDDGTSIHDAMQSYGMCLNFKNSEDSFYEICENK